MALWHLRYLRPCPLATLAGVVVASAMGGCGQIPVSGEGARSGYVLTPEEQSLGCRQLKDRLDQLMSDAKALPRRIAFKDNFTPTNVADFYARATKTPDERLADNYDKVRVEIAAFSRAHREKGCGDLGAEAAFDAYRAQHPKAEPMQLPTPTAAAADP